MMKASTVIWITSAIFGWLETAHYGWNWSAGSDAEMICDGIAMVMFCLAWLCHAIERQRTTVTINNHP